jgi:hypothetical protein
MRFKTFFFPDQRNPHRPLYILHNPLLISAILLA